MRVWVIFLGVLCASGVGKADDLQLGEGLLIKLPPHTPLAHVRERLPGGRRYKTVESVSPDLGLFRVELTEKGNLQSAIKAMRGTEGILYSQADEKLSPRSAVIPDDARFGSQWSFDNPLLHADVRAPAAWNTTTGGKNPHGQDIVVAVFDSGVDLRHPDLLDNLWTNPGEIPGNGVDDDKNGFIDDVHGWDVGFNSAEIPPSDHGTHIAGIIGARGNNGLGVAGINWNVKILALATSSELTSVIAKGVQYVLDLKKTWLATGGAKGANIVAINFSYGMDRKRCDVDEYPVWNDLFNEMGKLGIVTVAATANRDIDVDKWGDIPTSCQSDYLITVTNTDEKDEKFKMAGYGATSIDLGAPGNKILSTVADSKYDVSTGTSMSAPHVAGAVALMYSATSPALQNLIDAKPADAALEIKRLLLGATDPLPTLQGITVTGGRLNLEKAVHASSAF